MPFGLPSIGESQWGQKILDSINAVKDTADGAETTAAAAQATANAALPSASLDAEVAADISTVGSATETTLSALYAAKATQTAVESGRLSDATLSDTFVRYLPAPSGGDDTAALQSAIDASSPGDTIVFRGDGATYSVAATLTLQAGRRYVGGMPGGSVGPTKIQMAAGANLAAVVSSAGWYNNATTVGDPIIIENIQIDGNKANQTSGQGDGLVLMNWRCFVRNVQVINTRGNGFRLTAKNRAGTTISSTAVENRIEYCVAASCDGHGFYIEDPSGKVTDGWLLNSISSNSGGAGIWVDRSAGWRISGNHIYGLTGTHGIVAQWPFATEVTGNYVEDFGASATPGTYAGIYAASALQSNGVTVADNRVICASNVGGSTYYGVYVTSATSNSPELALHDNLVKMNGAGVAFRFGGGGTPQGTVTGNRAVNAASAVEFGGAGSASLRHMNNSWNWGAAAPAANYWMAGSQVWNTAPAPSGSVGWVCTTAGTPGTWKTFGAIGA